MKAFYAMFVVFLVLLFAAPMASAEDGSPSCPGESVYDLTGQGCVMGYSNGSAATESSAPKAAGLAASNVVLAQGLSCLSWDGDYDSVMMLTYGPDCLSRPADNAAALKPAGLAKPAPAPTQAQFGPCGAGESPDPLFLTCVLR